MKTRTINVRKVLLDALIVTWILISMLIFGRAALADCGPLPNGLQLNMPLADAFVVMKPFGPPEIVGTGVYEWNVDKASKLTMTAKDGKLKGYETCLTKKAQANTFNRLVRTWQLRVVEAYNNGYRIEFQVPLVVCYTCEGQHLYFIEITSNDGDLMLKRKWIIE